MPATAGGSNSHRILHDCSGMTAHEGDMHAEVAQGGGIAAADRHSCAGSGAPALASYRESRWDSAEAKCAQHGPSSEIAEYVDAGRLGTAELLSYYRQH
jgi:hypothetical protein